MIQIQSIKEVVHIKSSVHSGCPYCSDFDFSKDSENYVQDKSNHLMKKHGFFLLHVGQETMTDSNGHPWHQTVHVMGSITLIKQKPIPKLVIKFKA